MHRLFDKLKDRYSVFVLIVSLSFFILVFKLASLTIINGDELREVSNNKKVKSIPITAPRGEIRDRHGRLLAGNKPSFTVQLIKDELDTGNKKERNDTILKLIHILEAEGVAYKDEFPILFNSFVYKDENMYSQTTDTPTDVITNLVIDNNLLGELMSKDAKYSNNPNVKEVIVGKKVINILENQAIDVPIKVIKQNNEITFSYIEGKNIEKWLSDNKLQPNVDAKSAIINIINSRNTKNIVSKIVTDPIMGKMAYEILDGKGLVPDIKMEEVSFKYDEEYKSIKRNLVKNFKSVTMESKAKDDFINILKEIGGMRKLLEQLPTTEDEDDIITVVPGQVLLDKMKDNDIKVPVEVVVNKENNKVTYKYKNEKSKKEFLSKYKLPNNINALDAIIEVSEKEFVKEEEPKKKKKKKEIKEEKVEKETIQEQFIKDDEVKNLAQKIILDKYSNLRISTKEWEYTPIAEKTAWINRNKLDENKSAKHTFEQLKKKLELDNNLSDYEARVSMMILDEISKLGYRGYYPINIAYGINDKTVAKLEEHKLELPGVKVSLEPVRYYPYGQLAAHTLGSIGKIAITEEIDKYIKEKNYLPATLIGKTGVEATFEDYLKGQDGSKLVEADAHGNVKKVVKQVSAKPGDTLYLTLDAELQKVAEESLEKAMAEIRRGGVYESKWGNYGYGKSYPYAYSGSVVATDVKTGEVLALANYPSYDPNLFATGISSEDWKNLNPKNNLYGTPLLNTAIQTAVQPGSIFKMVTGIAGLENEISATKKIYDYGYIKIGSSVKSCLIWSSRRGSHGPTDLYTALEKSCNYYFYSVALGRIPKTGEVLTKGEVLEDILRVAKEFGLDEKTGIEVPAEIGDGKVPDVNSKTRTTKTLLERALKSGDMDIKRFIKEDAKLSDKQIESAIHEISSWADYSNPLTKSEVMNRLDELGIDGSKEVPKNKKRNPDLADEITFTYLRSSNWGIADTLDVSIGQGANAYTPLQMTNYVATLSNGGYRHKISVVDKIQSYDNSKKTYKPKKDVKRIKIKDYKYLEEAAKGMSMVTKSGGTAAATFANFPIDVAAKTGTAERGGVDPVTKRKYDNYAWFTAYAPYRDYDPNAAQIAVTVFIDQGGSGGYGAPIAREIIAEYFGLNNDTEDSKIDLNSKLSK